MNADYICPRLRKIIEVMYLYPTNNAKRETKQYEGSYARETENGMYTFGTRKPLTRNTVTKAIAIFLITTKIPEL